jgi:hypothetical protein
MTKTAAATPIKRIDRTYSREILEFFPLKAYPFPLAA